MIICRLCGASFTKEYDEQKYCDDCLRKGPDYAKMPIGNRINRITWRRFKNNWKEVKDGR
jgi:hypothetical protein